jgi:CHAT domain-containing protein
VLAGASASRQAVLREIGRHDLMHFAGHARVIGDNPGASHLVLARDSAGFGANVIYASEIANLHLDRVRLVVLSACGESRERFARSEGNGLVRAFLDAGAGGVIASQWEADDEATAELTRVLHRELRLGTLPDEALRRAQVALLTGSGWKPYAARRMWGGFRYGAESGWEK